MTIQHVAMILGVSENYIRKLVDRGMVASFTPADANVNYNQNTGRFELEREVEPEEVEAIEEWIWFGKTRELERYELENSEEEFSEKLYECIMAK